MKLLTLYLFLLLGALSCAQRRPGLSQSRMRPAVYSWNPANTGKAYADMDYQSQDTALCHLAFRVFLLDKGAPIPSSIQSTAYLGSFSLGMECDATFRLAIPQRFLDHSRPLVFTIIPLSPAGKPVPVDIRKNFKFHIVAE